MKETITDPSSRLFILLCEIVVQINSIRFPVLYCFGQSTKNVIIFVPFCWHMNTFFVDKLQSVVNGTQKSRILFSLIHIYIQIHYQHR